MNNPKIKTGKEIQQNNELVLDFAYKVMGRKLEMQVNAHNSLENKTGILLGFAKHPFFRQIVSPRFPGLMDC